MERRFALAVLAMLAALWFPAAPPAAARVTVSLMLDGVKRTALVDPGKDATTTPSPLVFVFHGSNRTASEAIGFGLAQAWPEATFVYPEGPARRNSVSGSFFGSSPAFLLGP